MEQGSQCRWARISEPSQGAEVWEVTRPPKPYFSIVVADGSEATTGRAVLTFGTWHAAAPHRTVARMSGLLAPAALGAFLAAAVTMVALHVVPSTANPVAEGTSAYALGPTAPGYQLQAVASGLGGLLLAGAMADRQLALPAIVCLVAYGLTRIAIVAYPTDARGAPMTPTGRNHAILAAIAFLGVAIAAPLSTPSLLDATAATAEIARPSRAVLEPLAWLVLLTSLASFGVAATPRTVPFYGVAQRVFHASAFAWLILASVLLAFGGSATGPRI